MAFSVMVGLEGRDRRMAVERPPMGRKPDRVCTSVRTVVEIRHQDTYEGH